MNNLVFLLIGVTGVTLVVVGNLLVEYCVVSKAEGEIRKHLGRLGFSFNKIRKVGLFRSGDFKDIEFSLFGNMKGNMELDLYRYIDFTDSHGGTKTMTVKIKWHLFKKTTLEYRPRL